LRLSGGKNLILTSTATNNSILQPEFAINAGNGNWYALTVQINRLVNGNLETVCGPTRGRNCVPAHPRLAPTGRLSRMEYLPNEDLAKVIHKVMPS